jgi:hypothetical protein
VASSLFGWAVTTSSRFCGIVRVRGLFRPFRFLFFDFIGQFASRPSVRGRTARLSERRWPTPNARWKSVKTSRASMSPANGFLRLPPVEWVKERLVALQEVLEGRSRSRHSFYAGSSGLSALNP